jgi:hypothetical protein
MMWGRQVIVTGEVSLSGRITGVGAVLAKATGLATQWGRFLFPVDNTDEVAGYRGPMELWPVSSMGAAASIIVRGEADRRREVMIAVPCLIHPACARPCADGPSGIPRPAHDLAEATMVLAPTSKQERKHAHVGLLTIEACVVPGTGQASHSTSTQADDACC